MVSMGIVWDRTTDFLSDNRPAVATIAGFAILLPAAISGTIEPLTARDDGTASTVQLASLALSLVSLWGQLAIVALALDPGAGRRGATAVASQRFVPLIVVLLVLLAGLLVLMLPLPIALGVAGFDFAAAMNGGNPDIPPGLGGFLLLYCLFCLVLLLWLVARLVLVTPVVVVERRWISALARSFRLTRPVGLKVLGVLILYAIVGGVSFLAAKLVFGSILGLIAGGEGLVTIGSAIAATLVALVVTVFNVLASAFTAKLYLAVRDAREAIVESL